LVLFFKKEQPCFAVAQFALPAVASHAALTVRNKDVSALHNNINRETSVKLSSLYETLMTWRPHPANEKKALRPKAAGPSLGRKRHHTAGREETLFLP
jgi:hypothetical protein